MWGKHIFSYNISLDSSNECFKLSSFKLGFSYLKLSIESIKTIHSVTNFSAIISKQLVQWNLQIKPNSKSDLHNYFLYSIPSNVVCVLKICKKLNKKHSITIMVVHSKMSVILKMCSKRSFFP